MHSTIDQIERKTSSDYKIARSKKIKSTGSLKVSPLKSQEPIGMISSNACIMEVVLIHLDFPTL